MARSSLKKGIQQAGFSHVGFADDYRRDPFPIDFTFLIRSARASRPRLGFSEGAEQASPESLRHFFLGEIDAASSRARRSSSSSFICRTSAANFPERWRLADSRGCRVWEWSKSMTASAWVRSMRPFRKARLVNSPGSARRAPLCRQPPKSPGEPKGSAVALDFNHVFPGISFGLAHEYEKDFIQDRLILRAG